jgi:murein DD-endopeptidase MepM/ murein hydrolase activator NlpD
VGAGRIKILFVPDNGGAVKQFSMSTPLLAIGVFILCCTVAYACWLIKDYMLISGQLPRLTEMEKASGQKEREFVNLCQRIDELEGDVKGLLALDQKLRSVADLEATQPEIGMLAMGGSELKSAQPIGLEVQSEKDPNSVLDRADAAKESRITRLTWESNESAGYPKHHQVLFASMAPISPANGFIMSAFGTQVSPGSSKTEFHRGIDIATRLGAPVLATSDGMVASIGWERGYGRILSVNHGDGLMTFYANLDQIFVRKGEYVKRGKRIAVAGKGGLDGPHLHYELRIDGISVNPAQFIPGIIHLSQSSVSP